MKIVLIFPRSDPQRGTKIKNHMVPPYGLQLLAGLTPPQHKVVLLDQFVRPIDMEIEADLIGISVWTGSSGNAYRLADAFRARGIPVVLGGPHVAVLPEEARQHADAVVVGEAEAVWEQLLEDFEAGHMAPVYEECPLPLSATPPVRWDIFRADDYVLQSAISTSRGCHFRCEFCYESSRPNSTYRRKPLDQVLEEIDSRPGPVIAFLDNDLLGDKAYARSLLEALIPRQKVWMAMTTIRFADDLDMVALAAAAGCKTLFVGFESISPESLQEVGKRQNRVEIYSRNIQRLHAHGIMVNGSFVFGFDHDGPEVFDETVRFGIENRIETATYTILTPYPNTGLYKKLQVQDRIFDYDWAHYDTTRVVFRPARMSARELEEGLAYAYSKFYSMGSILSRTFRPGAGAMKRLALNLAYKRAEPVWKTLDLGITARWIRPVTYWYMSATRYRQTVAHESLQAQPALE